MYYERTNHFQPILNLVGAAGSNGYCIPCNKKYDRVEDHRCSIRCYKCMTTPQCNVSEDLKKCSVCSRSFFGDSCYENHLKKGSFNKSNSVCEKIKICQFCCKTTRSKNKNTKHVCNTVFCSICKLYLPNSHLCYVQPLKTVKEKEKTSNHIFLFYDFETQQTVEVLGDKEKKIHTPNLCVVHQVCTFCIENTDISINCEQCGSREYVFKNNPVKQLVDFALEPRQKFKKVICIAHNAQGFDAQFIFKYIVDKCEAYRCKTSVIMNGSKIILLETLHVKFIDSLNYFHMPLSNLPKAYGLQEVEKGFFPHLFNAPQNQPYVGPLPPVQVYSPDNMNNKEREIFLAWYNEQASQGYIFNFQEEIEKYCKQDVSILRLACLAFRKNFIKYNVDPFVECTTIASSCMRVFRKNFLKKNQIGIVPSGGYRWADRQSNIAMCWLSWMQKCILKRPIEHAGRCRERRLPEIGTKVDGYSPPQDGEDHKGIVLQFHGCFWHGCRRCYRINRDAFLAAGDSLDDRLERTLTISNKIKENNYKLIEMWECDFRNEITQNEDLQSFIEEENSDGTIQKPLDPRDAFFGGRTGNTVKMIDCTDQEKIKYVDVCSLYPFICKRGNYPVGHPKIYVGQEECARIIGFNNDLSKINGLIKCKILPPQNLYHPLLPVRMHGKLIFPLCRTCCEQMVQEDCPHKEQSERVLLGTWVSEEVKEAIKHGYVIKHVYEIWQYKMTSYNQEEHKGGIFAEYINEFFKQKVMASGYPAGCITTEDKDEYIKNLELTEGICLNKNEIQYNAGLRSVAKLCLNSLWGKFGQRENLTKTEVITEPEKLTALLTSPEIDVTGILPVNDEALYVNWCYKTEALTPSPAMSVVLASFTTSQARIQLFNYLHVLGPRALYYDTDSVFYVSKAGEPDLPTGRALGELTDELADNGLGTYITSFLSGGPKFYAYRYKKPNGSDGYVCKVKGIRLNYTNSQQINFDTIREMISSQNDKIILSNRVIRRTVFHEVITQNETKTCKPVYGKRRFITQHKSYPYGYVEDRSRLSHQTILNR